jgi:phage terminase large subunit-like protein
VLFLKHRNPLSLEMRVPENDYVYQFMNPVDNLVNLSKEYIDSLKMLPERQRRRFFDGKYQEETEGQLWSAESLDRARAMATGDVSGMRRVVVAVDPSGCAGSDDWRSDEVGIVVAGVTASDEYVVLADRSGRYSPEQWGRIAVNTFREFSGDRIIAEKNFGGDMVGAVLRNVDANIPFSFVTASRGKVVRAEPIAALYEQGKVKHAGRFEKLEDQMLQFSTAGYLGEKSPDRADALVWALSELAATGNDPLIAFYDSLLQGAGVKLEAL